MNNVANWLYGLLAAAIGAVGSAVPLVIVAPESFNFSHAGLLKLAEMCAVNALLAVGLYLKQSPLPAIQTTTQTLTLETKVTPAPEPPKGN